MLDFTWITVAQPLFIARTGMNRILLGQRPGKTEDEWQETLEAAESGIEAFCRPERVYAIGLHPSGSCQAKPAYLTAGGIYHDDGGQEAEVYMTADTAEGAQEEALRWVTDWMDRAKRRLAELDAD